MTGTIAGSEVESNKWIIDMIMNKPYGDWLSS